MQKVNIFVSYAHRNKVVFDLLDKMSDHLKTMLGYDITLWHDISLKEGFAWEDEIRDNIINCDLVLMMLSPAFLASNYIMQKEVPLILEQEKAFIPICVAPLDHQLHDLQGLGKYQYYMLNKEGFSKPRAYNEIKGRNKEEFALQLCRIIKERLDSIFD